MFAAIRAAFSKAWRSNGSREERQGLPLEVTVDGVPHDGSVYSARYLPVDDERDDT